jgi:hypothetical protein
MANQATWITGGGVGFTWTTAINGADLASLASGSTALSSVADIANQTALDLYADVSVRLTVGSATPAAGAFLGLYLVPLLDDGSTYGDGELAAGGTMARAYPFPPAATMPLANVATTLLAGFAQAIVIPPGSFRFALYNGGSGISLSTTAGNNVVKYRTYRLNLNG